MNEPTNQAPAITAEQQPGGELALVNLLGLSPDGMLEFCQSIGEKSFRAQQLLKWIHQRGIDDFAQMTDLSKALREKLATVACVKAPEIVSELHSEDGTSKWLVRVEGGSCIETVLIPDNGRRTLCISSQVGCALDCSFCATGKQGFQRDLTAAEIIGQVWLVSKALTANGELIKKAVSNVVMMGMGEPLLNFNNVLASVQLMMNDYCYGISKRRVTVSTSGVVPGIDELSRRADPSLALSLHAPTDELRNVLVPLNKKYPLKQVLASCQRYLDSLPDKKRKITIEYTLIKGVNDSVEQAEQTARLLKDLPCKINLIPFNPFSLVDYQRPSNNGINRFRQVLLRAGYTVTVRTTRGDDIAAACGQLAGEVSDRTRRSERYQRLAAARSASEPQPINLRA